MLTISFDAAVLGPVLLVLCLSAVLGTAVGVLGFFMEGAAALFLGVAEAIASGGRSSGSSFQTKANKGAVAFRAFVYLALVAGAVALSLTGHQVLAYLCAVAGGVALPIAVMKLFK